MCGHSVKQKIIHSPFLSNSLTWGQRCRETATHVDESIFPAIDPSEGMPPNIIKKKRKCMQPKDLVIKTPENDRRLAKKFDKMLKELEDQKTSVDIPTLSFDDDGSLLYSPIAVIADRCNAMEKRLQEMRDKRENLSPTASQMSQTAFDIPCLKPSLGNSPSVMPESPLEKNGIDLNSSYEELFGNVEEKNVVSTSFKTKADMHQEANSLTLSVEDININPFDNKGSTSRPGTVKRHNSNSRTQSRSRRSNIKPKTIDITDNDSSSDVIYGTPKVKNESHGLDSPSLKINPTAKTYADSADKSTVSPFLHNKDQMSGSKATDCRENDTNGYKYTAYKMSTSLSLDSPSLVKSLSEMCKNKGKPRKSNCHSGKPESGSSSSKSTVKGLDKSNPSPCTFDSEFDDFFSSYEIKGNKKKSSRLSLVIQPRRSPSPPLIFESKKSSSKQGRCNDGEQLEAPQAKRRKTIHAVNHFTASPVQSTIQEVPTFTSVLKKNGPSAAKGFMASAVVSPLYKRRESGAKVNLLNIKPILNPKDPVKIQPYTDMNLESGACLSSEMNNVTNTATSNRTQDEDIKNAKSSNNVVHTGHENHMKNSLLPSTESKTSGSDAISGVSEMFNEQRHKCTEESRKTEKSRKVTRSLVMTSMSSEKQNTVIQVVKKFGGFTFSDQVCESTTHVISGNPRRTLNIIFGIARGCWIVSYDWILWSLERGHWLPEEPYELSDHFPGATICRLQRHLSAGEYYQDFLSSVPPLFIAPSSEPPCDKLSELVQLCGGKLCKTLRQAKICIGLFMGKKPQDMQSVSEKWLLDSISQHKLHPLENYLLAL
ncbi:microcephalin isoform X2 [Hyperolius riggenbachi]|uniref:microcephalin isoform X2 n=1 Tax=Hyperolius riggenbachi TaxID=752182 RepID=UPI0035A39E2B